jgi:alanine racemase
VEKPILICSPLPPGSYREAVASRLTVSISDLEALGALQKAGEAVGTTARFHLEVDTGMGRAGFDWHRVDQWGPEMLESLGPNLTWEGCFTHFHSADGVEEGPTSAQWARLLATVDSVPGKPESLLVHACNSPGSLRLPEFARDAVRPGIFLYGGVAGEGIPAPLPVAALRARIVFMREAVSGTTVGYGSTYAASKEERWASVGIGYGDGLPRLLSNRGQALVHGKRVPIIGRVSMDLTVLDVTEVPDAGVGDVVTFFGAADAEKISLEEVAGHAETINYEVLTGLTRRLPRIWTDHGGY